MLGSAGLKDARERLLGRGLGDAGWHHSRWVSSLVAGFVSFLLTSILGVTFGILVFRAVPGGTGPGVQMAILGVSIVGNALLSWSAELPWVVVTADNGVVAPIAAGVVAHLSTEIQDRDALLATSMTAVALACAVFGFVQLLMMRMKLVRVVQFLPYSIPMGFLSGIGLELCAGVTLAGGPLAQVAATGFALFLCLGSWWRGWSLSVLFPVLLSFSVGMYYALGAPADWLLDVEGIDSNELTFLWSGDVLSKVHWTELLTVGGRALPVLCLLGCFQNCLFAELYAKAAGPHVHVEPSQVLYEFGQAFMCGGVMGFAGGFHNMACFSVGRELDSFERAPSMIVASMSLLLWFVGLRLILFVPKFIFAGLLLWVGLKFLRSYLFQPAKMLPRAETAVIVCVACTMKIGGFATGVGIGLFLALLGMVGQMASHSAVQHVSTLQETRSNVVRSVDAEALLLNRGCEALVLRLAPGLVLFATAAQLLGIIEDRLKSHTAHMLSLEAALASSPPATPRSSSHSADRDQRFASPVRAKTGDLPNSLSHIVIDFSLCQGFDGSLIGILQQIATLGQRKGFKLLLAGLQPSQRSWLMSHTAAGVCHFFPDLDRALADVEDALLTRAGMSQSDEMQVSALQTDLRAPRRLTDDADISALVDGTLPETSSPIVLFLYSDASASSRSLRKPVAHALALLQQRFEVSLTEASADHCPGLVAKFGPSPALVLLLGGQAACRMDVRQFAEELCGAAKQSTHTGTRGTPVATAIVRELEQHLSSSVSESGTGSRSLTLDVDSPARSSSKMALPHPVSWEKADPVSAWALFLERANLPNDGPWARLAKYVTMPKPLRKGEVLLYKGAEQAGILFLVHGFLSLWNEGITHNQEHDCVSLHRQLSRRSSGRIEGALAYDMQDCDECDTPKMRLTSSRFLSNRTEKEHAALSKGTSRLLRVGPGWVFGGTTGTSSGCRLPLAHVTYMADSNVTYLKLPLEAAQELHRNDPAVALALHEVLEHFDGILVQHLLVQLSDWNCLIFAEPEV